MGNPRFKSKQEHLSECVSRRFANPKQELAIQTTAGIFRDIAATKGGHNSPKSGFRPYGEKRVKPLPYKWGTLGSRTLSAPEPKKGHSPTVAKQYRKQEAYKSKINSRVWKRGRAQ